jgi:hypothetical protein
MSNSVDINMPIATNGTSLAITLAGNNTRAGHSSSAIIALLFE